MKTLNEIIPEFLAIVNIQVSDKVYKTYGAQLKRFSDFLPSDLPISNIPSGLVGAFFLELASTYHLDRPTCQKYFIALRRLWQFAVKHGYTDNLPFDTVEFPKKGEDMSSEVISPDHAKVLLTEIEKKDPQLYLACLTQYYCFLRPGKELRLLRVGDIDFSSGLIRVPQERAKNGHARTVTMPNHLLEQYQKQGIDKADSNLYVFGASHEPDIRPCSINMLRYRFNKYRDAHGMSKKYHLYSMKHSGCSMLHDSRIVSMRELMDQLGHTKLSSTEHYLRRLSTGVNTRIKESFPAPY